MYSNLIKKCNQPGAFYTNTRIVPKCFVYQSSTGVQLNTVRSLRPLHTLPPGREIVKEIRVKYRVKCIAVITNNRVITT